MFWKRLLCTVDLIPFELNLIHNSFLSFALSHERLHFHFYIAISQVIDTNEATTFHSHTDIVLGSLRIAKQIIINK